MGVCAVAVSDRVAREGDACRGMCRGEDAREECGGVGLSGVLLLVVYCDVPSSCSETDILLSGVVERAKCVTVG